MRDLGYGDGGAGTMMRSALGPSYRIFATDATDAATDLDPCPGASQINRTNFKCRKLINAERPALQPLQRFDAKYRRIGPYVFLIKALLPLQRL